MPLAIFKGIPGDIISGVAISSLIFLFSGWLPVVGSLGLLALPLPVFYYRAKLGRRNGFILLAVVTAVIATIAGGMSPDLIFVAGLLMTGFVLCELVEKKMTIERTLIFTGGLVFGAGFFFLIIYSNLAGLQPGAMLSAYVGKNLALSLQLYEEVGMPEEKVRLIAESMETIQYYLIRILPALAGAFLLFIAWITFLGARAVLVKKGVGFPDFGNLNTWQAPEMLVWGVIGGGVMLLLPNPPVRLIALNVLILLTTIYFFQGIAVISYFFGKRGLPTALRFLIYSMIVLWHLLLVFVVGLGFFDTWADFRRLKKAAVVDAGPDE